VYLNVSHPTSTVWFPASRAVSCYLRTARAGSQSFISGSDPEARELKMNEGPEIWDV